MFYRILSQGETDMKKLFCLALALMLLTCGALAETREEILEALGICTIDAYEGKINPNEDCPYVIHEWMDSDSGLLTWDIPWDNDNDGEADYSFGSHWFRPAGAIADVECDLDHDGADERIVLFNRYEMIDDYPRNMLMLRIYEQDASGLRMADEVLLSREFDDYNCYINVLIDQPQRSPRLIVQCITRVDGYTNKIREILYDGSSIYAGNGCGWLAADCIRQWDYYPESEPAGEEFNWDCDDSVLYDYGSDEEFDATVRDFDARFVRLGLGWTEGAYRGSIRAIQSDNALQLAEFDIRGQLDDEGRIVARLQFMAPGRCLRTTGSVNLRSEPNLNGEIITSVETDIRLLRTGKESVDERGVTWYEVSHNGTNCWVSSRYSQPD